MFHSIMFLLLNATVYGPVQAHQDSLFIYQAYVQGDTLFEQAAEPGQWKPINDSIARVTAPAFARLHRYNKEQYASVDELNRETVGVALVFPEPRGLAAPDVTKTDANKVTGAPVSDKDIAFKVLDEQTHFLIGPNGKGRIPYIVMNYYAKGRILVKSEKLNPVTHLPIQIPGNGPGLATSSN